MAIDPLQRTVRDPRQADKKIFKFTTYTIILNARQ